MTQSDPESRRIEEVYGGYADAKRAETDWNPANAGNRAMLDERLRLTYEALVAIGMWPPTGFGVLEVGCGRGNELARFASWGADPGQLTGVDLLPARVAEARASYPRIAFETADARSLQSPPSSFRLVCVLTLFSSILDDTVAHAVASEIDRVLEPSGAVLWYDVRVRNRNNANTRPYTLQDVMALFPGYEANLRSATLIPPLARRLGPLTPVAYRVLTSVPALRTHLVGTLRKPAGGLA